MNSMVTEVSQYDVWPVGLLQEMFTFLLVYVHCVFHTSFVYYRA